MKEEIKTINKSEAMELINLPLGELAKKADEIRKKRCGDFFDLCTIINGKSGRCTENCKFCAQSAFYNTNITQYNLLDKKKIFEEAKLNQEAGVLRYSIVTSGKKLSDQEVELVCQSIREIKEKLSIKVCGSFGLLNYGQFKKLKDAGLERVHNNLETSEAFFSKVCTTHTFDEKIHAIHEAQKAGLSICSGGIFGLGETMEDRIDMAFTLKTLGVKSVPINLLNPIAGTPLEKNRVLSEEELCRIIAIYRHILPDVSIRLAGGRGLLEDKGESCFKSGANAAISGDMLTTAGITVATDMEMLQRLGFQVRLQNE